MKRLETTQLADTLSLTRSFQEALAPLGLPDSPSRAATLVARGKGSSRLPCATRALGRWLTFGTVVVALHWMAAQYMLWALSPGA